MIEHIWSVICLNVSIDRDTNSISIFNVLENLDIYTEKTENINIPIEFTIASLWRKQDKSIPEKGEMRIGVVDPLNIKQYPVGMEVNLMEHQFFRSISKFIGFNIPAPGTFIFNVEFRNNPKDEWKICANIPLGVIIHYKEKQKDITDP